MTSHGINRPRSVKEKETQDRFVIIEYFDIVLISKDIKGFVNLSPWARVYESYKWYCCKPFRKWQCSFHLKAAFWLKILNGIILHSQITLFMLSKFVIVFFQQTVFWQTGRSCRSATLVKYGKDWNIGSRDNNGRHFADDSFKRIFLTEMHAFRLRLHWSLFQKFELTIFQH